MKLINAIILLAGLSVSAGYNLRGQERRIEVRKLSSHKSTKSTSGSSGSSSSSSSTSSGSGSRSGRGRCGRVVLVDKCDDDSYCEGIADDIEESTRVRAVCVSGRRALPSTTSGSGSGSGSSSGSGSRSSSSSSSSSSGSGSSRDERTIGTHTVTCDTSRTQVEITVKNDLDRTFSESRADRCARAGSSGSSSSSSSSSSSGSSSRSSGSSGSTNKSSKGNSE